MYGKRNLSMTNSCSSQYKVKFGNLEHYTTKSIFEYLLFGTKLITKIH